MKAHFLVIGVVGLVASLFACSEESPESAAHRVNGISLANDTLGIEPCAEITRAMLHGRVDPASDSAFARIPSELSTKSNLFLRQDALEAFKNMASAARSAGITLKVISATRSWEHQRSIWNRKWNSPKYMGFEPLQRAERILEYSSMPGSSRHHWGTDLDLNSLENAYFEEGSGAAVYAWLTQNAADYGFVQVYGDQRNGRPGYREEKWHWSYWPLAQDFLRCYLEEQENHSFDGFDGAEFSDSLGIVERYVAGIDSLH
jgi:D-alanyl-D-alanine carboxypeptidase